MSQVKVIEKAGHQVLFTCPLDESDKAYKYASELEELGVEVQVLSPSIAETLGETLGVNEEEMEDFKASMEAEISSHLDDSDSCCFKAD